MLKKSLCLLMLAIAILLILFTGGCAVRVRPCPPSAIVSTEMMNFVCPQCGVGYQAYAVMCAGESRYRVGTTCPVCGFNYRYNVSRWPYPYVWSDYYFYGGWWYHHNYWNQYWHYSPPYRPPVIVIPPRPPVRPPVTPPPGVGRGDRGRIDTPPRLRNDVQRPPVPPRPQAPRVERPAPTSRPPSPPPVNVRPRPEPPRDRGRPPN